MDKEQKTQPARGPERAALAAAIAARDASAAALADALKAREHVAQRLAKEKRDLSDAHASDDDGEVARDLGDLDTLVKHASARRQKADDAGDAIGVLERALHARDLAVGESRGAVADAEREVARAARQVLSAAIGPLFAGLAELEEEVVRRRFALAFLIRNEIALQGPGRLGDEAEAVRALLRRNQFPSDNYTPAAHVGGNSTTASWQAALERLAVDPDAALPE